MVARDKIVALRKDNAALSVAEIARMSGVTRQRAHQILAPMGLAKRNQKIGASRRREYKCWWAMLDRCLNPANKSFHHYGGRGITVCKRWMGFEAFFSDMGKKPQGLSIERINNNGGYSPSNCKWATQSEQCRNMRRKKKAK